MTIRVTFWSYFAELAGVPEAAFEVDEGTTLDGLVAEVHAAHPRLAPMRGSTLKAVGVEYRPGDHVLRPGDSVALFPPVQGG